MVGPGKKFFRGEASPASVPGAVAHRQEGRESRGGRCSTARTWAQMKGSPCTNPVTYFLLYNNMMNTLCMAIVSMTMWLQPAWLIVSIIFYTSIYICIYHYISPISRNYNHAYWSATSPLLMCRSMRDAGGMVSKRGAQELARPPAECRRRPRTTPHGIHIPWRQLAGAERNLPRYC
jgi:hypothetical protein